MTIYTSRGPEKNEQDLKFPQVVCDPLVSSSSSKHDGKSGERRANFDSRNLDDTVWWKNISLVCSRMQSVSFLDLKLKRNRQDLIVIGVL